MQTVLVVETDLILTPDIPNMLPPQWMALPMRSRQPPMTILTVPT